MTRKMLRSLSLAVAVFASLVTLRQTAQAGPPLICHPFEIGNAKSLPWGGSEWRAVKADYEINRLVGDTLALLTSDAPVLVRMETLRRATVYAVWGLSDRKVGYPVKDLSVAKELLSRLQARVQEAQGKAPAEALALFDLGYLVESYKQANYSHQLNLAGGIDGYASVVRAIGLRGRDPEMEFAAALMIPSSQRDAHEAHLKRAIAGAPEGSLLARNLVSHFDQRGKNLAELRANLGMARN